MKVYLAWDGNYGYDGGPSLIGVFATRNLAEKEQARRVELWTPYDTWLRMGLNRIHLDRPLPPLEEPKIDTVEECEVIDG